MPFLVVSPLPLLNFPLQELDILPIALFDHVSLDSADLHPQLLLSLAAVGLLNLQRCDLSCDSIAALLQIGDDSDLLLVFFVGLQRPSQHAITVGLALEHTHFSGVGFLRFCFSEKLSQRRVAGRVVGRQCTHRSDRRPCVVTDNMFESQCKLVERQDKAVAYL